MLYFDRFGGSKLGSKTRARRLLTGKTNASKNAVVFSDPPNCQEQKPSEGDVRGYASIAYSKSPIQMLK